MDNTLHIELNHTKIANLITPISILNQLCNDRNILISIHYTNEIQMISIKGHSEKGKMLIGINAILNEIRPDKYALAKPKDLQALFQNNNHINIIIDYEENLLNFIGNGTSIVFNMQNETDEGISAAFTDTRPYGVDYEINNNRRILPAKLAKNAPNLKQNSNDIVFIQSNNIYCIDGIQSTRVENVFPYNRRNTRVKTNRECMGMIYKLISDLETRCTAIKTSFNNEIVIYGETNYYIVLTNFTPLADGNEIPSWDQVENILESCHEITKFRFDPKIFLQRSNMLFINEQTPIGTMSFEEISENNYVCNIATIHNTNKYAINFPIRIENLPNVEINISIWYLAQHISCTTDNTIEITILETENNEKKLCLIKGTNSTSCFLLNNNR